MMIIKKASGIEKQNEYMLRNTYLILHSKLIISYRIKTLFVIVYACVIYLISIL